MCENVIRVPVGHSVGKTRSLIESQVALENIGLQATVQWYDEQQANLAQLLRIDLYRFDGDEDGQASVQTAIECRIEGLIEGKSLFDLWWAEAVEYAAGDPLWCVAADIEKGKILFERGFSERDAIHALSGAE